MTTNQIADEAAHVRRMVARLRRMLAAAPAGIPRGQLRNRLNSREKYLFDTAMDLLVAVGDVVVGPAAQGGTRYTHAEYAGVVPAGDSETSPTPNTNNDRGGHS